MSNYCFPERTACCSSSVIAILLLVINKEAPTLLFFFYSWSKAEINFLRFFFPHFPCYSPYTSHPHWNIRCPDTGDPHYVYFLEETPPPNWRSIRSHHLEMSDNIGGFNPSQYTALYVPNCLIYDDGWSNKHVSYDGENQRFHYFLRVSGKKSINYLMRNP